MFLLPVLRTAALLVLLAPAIPATTACAGQHGDILHYTDRDDIRRGPGLFSGEEGAFTATFGGDRPDEQGRSKEYEEFQRWKEWREYQDWKQRRREVQ